MVHGKRPRARVSEAVGTIPGVWDRHYGFGDACDRIELLVEYSAIASVSTFFACTQFDHLEKKKAEREFRTPHLFNVVSLLTLGTGRTTVLQGIVNLVMTGAIFLVVAP